MKLRMQKCIALGLAAVLCLSGCGKKEASEVPSQTLPESSSVMTESSEPEESALTAEEIEEDDAPEGQVTSYLTGEHVDESIGRKRPVAIMLSNVKDAVPQSGIEKASIVYEAPVEGGITRLMGLYEDYTDLDKIGSVRSARKYYVELALAYNAVYISYGHSKYAEKLLDKESTDNLDGVEGSGANVFYRTSDRVAPHNAYTSTEGILKGIETQGFNMDYSASYEGYFDFVHTGESTSYEGNEATTVKPGYVHNAPSFTYNEEDGLYYRSQFGDKQVDIETGNQLAFKNLILQYCDYEMFGDGKSLDFDTTSGGNAKYIANGVAVDMTWTYDKDTGIAHFFLEDGSELKMNPGKTYVGIILNADADKVEIS